MADIDKKVQGPIIEQDNRKTKPYSKRIVLFGLLLIAAVIFIIASQARQNINSDIIQQDKSYNAPKQDFEAMFAGYHKNAKKPLPIVISQEIKQEVIYKEAEKADVVIQHIQQPTRRKYYSNEADQQAAGQLRMMNIQAIMNPPKVEGFGDNDGQSNQANNDPMAALTAQLASAKAQSASQSSGLNPAQLAELVQGASTNDPNRQNQKANFLRKGGGELTSQGYSENLPEPQKFYLEIKAGTVIPGMLVTGLNSDLPGPVVGQVTQNVWDSTHGRYVLIPKGTRIIGVYDSQVTYGQKRVLVVWNRLIFPNGTSLNIAGSPGLDQAGYSGMKGKVNEHWGRMISTALLASLFVTGAEIISPKEQSSAFSGNNNAKNPGEIASEQAANVILEMAGKLMDKNMDIQPTITIRPGGRFNIFVEQDIVFPEPFPIDY